MGKFKGGGFWRGMGWLANTGAGTSLMDGLGGVVGKMAALGGSAPLQGPPPWAPFEKALPECRMGVVTTAGFHQKDDQPFDVDALDGDASFREFSSALGHGELTVSHTHFSHKRYDEDPNVILPLDRLRELVDSQVVRELGPRIYSFGFGGYLTRPYLEVPDGSATVVARKLLEDEVDFALLVPA